MVARVGHGGGINCTLSYKKDGKTRAYRLRAVSLTHGLAQVAEEGHARTTRAYYPHRRSQAQFMVTFALLARKKVSDHSEYERFNVWMRQYMSHLLDLDQVKDLGMLVTIPTRNFVRQGIPLGPLQFGEHVGSMVWNQTITFETTVEPNDPKFALSKFDAGNAGKDKNLRFQYPSEQNQLSGNQRPDAYDTVALIPQEAAAGIGTTVVDPGEVQSAVTGPYRESTNVGSGGRGGI